MTPVASIPSSPLSSRIEKRLRVSVVELDGITRRHTAFDSYAELINAPGYFPSLNVSIEERRLLADAYDLAMQERVERKRAHRWRACSDEVQRPTAPVSGPGESAEPPESHDSPEVSGDRSTRSDVGPCECRNLTGEAV